MKADGFCKSNNTIYEFHGDFWHGNPKKYIDTEFINTVSKKSMKTLYEKTIKRDNRIRELGYNLVVMLELDWNNLNKAFKKLQIKFRNNHFI